MKIACKRLLAFSQVIHTVLTGTFFEFPTIQFLVFNKPIREASCKSTLLLMNEFIFSKTEFINIYACAGAAKFAPLCIYFQVNINPRSTRTKL